MIRSLDEEVRGSTAQAPYRFLRDMSATGGISGRPEVGDVFALTTTEALDTFSLLSTWNGSATTVQVRFVNQAGGDLLQNLTDRLHRIDIKGNAQLRCQSRGEFVLRALRPIGAEKIGAGTVACHDAQLAGRQNTVEHRPLL